jgi:hypothetical protein
VNGNGRWGVVDLLLPAGGIEFDFLDEHRIVEIRHGRVVEREVAVFSKAGADEIDRSLA